MGEIELDPEQEAEMREQLLEFAECMRDHGIDMPDPVFYEDGRVTMSAEAGERFEPGDDETFEAASEECGRDGAGWSSTAATPATKARTDEGLAAARRRRRPRRRSRVAGVALFGDDDPSGADAEAASAEEPATLVDVVRRDLARTEELDGTVAYGDATPLVLAVEGTLTGLPDVGDVIEAGDVIAEVDGQPVVALNGPTPLWRTLGPGVDDGTDVLVVEYVLAAMGYAEEHDMTVDEEWTSATTEAVEDFQADHGQDDDGQIDLGEVVFIDGPVRVDAVAGALGQRASEAGIEVTSPERAVHLDLPVDDADLHRGR